MSTRNQSGRCSFVEMPRKKVLGLLVLVFILTFVMVSGVWAECMAAEVVHVVAPEGGEHPSVDLAQMSAPAGYARDLARAQSSLALRGYGRVSAEGVLWRNQQGQELSLVAFACQDSASAQILASKYRADFLAYGAVTVASAPKGMGVSALQVRHGGLWGIGTWKNIVYVACAADPVVFPQALSAWGAQGWSPAQERAYPRYLDCFDNNGLGIWWMPTSKSPEQLAWMKDFPAAVNLHCQELDRNPAAGVYDLSGAANAISQVAPLGKAYRYMLWLGKGHSSWVDWLTLSGHQLDAYDPAFTGRALFESSGYQAGQCASPLVRDVMQNALVNMMRRKVDDPNVLGWMEPHGEFFMSDPAMIPPGYRDRFPAFLQLVKKYTLSTISTAYTGSSRTYPGWDKIEYPDTAFFAGRRDNVLDLDSSEWRWKSGTREEGEKEGWVRPDFADTAWALDKRESKHILAEWDGNRKDQPLWFRFEAEVPASFIEKSNGHPIFLHILPYTEGKNKQVYASVNGGDLREAEFNRRDHINRHAVLDVTALIKVGKNAFAIYSPNGRIAYRVFLSNIPAEAFPFADVRLNRRFVDWRDYLIWEKLQTLESYLRAMRSIDPSRPIKLMTPHLFQTEALELCEQYGAYPQLTGEGGWYRPMHYKSYARLRRLPGTSEPGGAMENARDSQRMFSNIFWEGQDCHDYVFDFDRDFWRFPDVVKWWADNKPLLRTLGKVDFAEPQVGVLRDTAQDSRYTNHEIWNWDLSRGPLPAMGQSPVLIDGGDFAAGRADHLPVIIDCATIVMDEAMVSAVERYVRGGGIFIAQHHTGRDTPEQREAWPLAKRFGLRIEPKYLNNGDHNKWPLRKIAFTQEQTVLPALRGKSCEGSGVSIDWNSNETTGAVAILGEAKKCSPVAFWEDKSMAVVDVRHGKGRMILAGTPFFLRFRDESGKWLNEEARQDLLRGMLTALGVKMDTAVSDPRIWCERRESKNGLYDVYYACVMGLRGSDWKIDDVMTADITLRTGRPARIVDAASEGIVDVAATASNGALSLVKQTFVPYKVRQFAIVRKNVGLDGPLHWLEVQRRYWRALTPVPSGLADEIEARAQKVAEGFGEKGLDISGGWKVRINPEKPDDLAWLTEDPTAWQDGAIGSWNTLQWPQARIVQYRKMIELPAPWDMRENRLLLGLLGYWSLGIHDTGKLWINGKLFNPEAKGLMLEDITACTAGGRMLDIALEVRAQPSPKKTDGPAGTLYLRLTPAPIESLEIKDGISSITGWQSAEAPVALPFSGKAIGLKIRVKIPAEWAGRPVHLRVDLGVNGASCLGAVLVNTTGYMFCESFAPRGPRLDRWLKAGEENVIEILGRSHRNQDPQSTLTIRDVALEVYPPQSSESR